MILQNLWYQWEVIVSRENILRNVQHLLPEVKEIRNIEIVEKGEGEAVLGLLKNRNRSRSRKSFYSEYDIRSVFGTCRRKRLSDRMVLV